MDAEAFRVWGKRMIDLVADHWTTLAGRKPLPDVQPGYMKSLIPEKAPTQPESWETIFADLEEVIMRGNTNWHHPRFFAYYPTACSYPAIMADILSGGIASIGFTWKSGPSMTELEMAVTDWLVHALDLPRHFLNSDPGPGCGIIQSTASDATLVALLAARARVVARNTEGHSLSLEGVFQPAAHDSALFARLVAYASDQAHSSVDKDAMLCGVKLRKLKSQRDERLGNFTVTAATLEAAIAEDRARGLQPFIFVATLGTTNSCGVDWLADLGPVCEREKLWLHVDAAYADSFNFNAHKALLVNFDCSPMWFKDGAEATAYFDVNPLYLRHEHQANVADYRSENGPNEVLVEKINADRRIHLVPASVHSTFFLRLAVCSASTTDADIRFAYDVIRELAGLPPK